MRYAVEYIIVRSPMLAASLAADEFSSSSSQTLLPAQSTRFLMQAQPWLGGKGRLETEQHTTSMLANIIRGQPIVPTTPPSLDLRLSTASKVCGVLDFDM
jgi:hypothetical protein